jgi:hypothetical protein
LAKICVSYKLEELEELEERELARQFSEVIKRLGHQAVHGAVALEPGVNWRHVLQEAMSRTAAVVVLLLELARSSPFIMGQIGAAWALHHAFGHLLLRPVLVGDLAIPGEGDDLLVERMTPDSAVTGSAPR